MKNFYLKPLFSVSMISLGLLTACSQQHVVEVVPMQPTKILTATGYGTAQKSDKFSRSQIKLMAMRSSKMDAYRSLSEQVFGLHLRGMTTVENMIVTNDSYRAYVGAYLRGAKVKRASAIGSDIYAGDDTFETVVELELTPHFFECLNGSPEFANQCVQQSDTSSIVSRNEWADPVKTVAAANDCNSADCYKHPDVLGFYRHTKTN